MIWSGLGFLVAVITFGACLLMNYALDAQYGKGFYSSHSSASGLALAIGGLISAIVGFLLKGRNDREVIDVETGERFILNRSEHTFFFVPMHWAGLATFALGVGIAFHDLLT